jgi:hypothetical protein
MKVPYGTFSKTDWKKIKDSLASIGVDLNRAKISAHVEARSAGVYRYSAGNHPWLSAVLSAGPPWPLDEVLQKLAYFHTLSKPKTPKQWAKKLVRALTKIEKALGELNFVRLAPANYRVTAKDRALYDHTMRIAAELRERIAELQATDSRSQNALTVLGRYCRELIGLWLACGDGKLHENALREFLFGCSRAPFAQDMNTVNLEEKIDSIISNLPHSRKRQP